ncbi:glycosyltransferase involved in cell wall biosynthesis [Caldalkalibacillus uzonensis]|uniref:Glycosyltransferase involved in cell wall biosynthesis n=1 Tax=Caldalkalibacillus uzonensis TaxID=353224 RepID=A0ABU0CQ52_9BACI|nr:glycosyltransferase family 2 protein [Caldalkalibacillus uzonensis]MDQ0338504.1 glycosyltransferase involved in cell wall biosynthesis [Caldalkalibacillus uzonensis]
MFTKPTFSFLLVVRNEEKYLENLLKSVLNQEFPSSKYEIIIVDGLSSDRTPDIIDKYIKLYPSRIRCFQNPKQTLPSGWNIGIKNSNGRYVIRVDGHCQIPKDFLAKTYAVIQTVPDAACVGGIIKTKGKGFWGKVNAYVYSHPFGVGNSKFRTLNTHWEGYVDTVPYGAYRRDIFDQVGYFREDLQRNEDLEMHARIRNQGGNFYLSTTIQSVYFARDTLWGLIKKSLGDGKWTFIAARKSEGVLRLRHYIPLLAFLSGLTLAMMSILSQTFLLLFLGLSMIYFLLVAVSAIKIIREHGWAYYFPAMLAFFILHLTRGLGSMLSFLSPEYWRKSSN